MRKDADASSIKSMALSAEIVRDIAVRQVAAATIAESLMRTP